jgi:hypothetical protein
VEYTDEYGTFFENGHFEFGYIYDDKWNICGQPNIPFIFLTDNKNNIVCSASGGSWADIPAKLKLIGKRKKEFKAWEHFETCSSKGVIFEATVNVWEYKEPNQFHGEYTTKDYDRHYISYCADEQGNPKDASGYRYFGDGIAFFTKADYEAWRDTFRGVEFLGYSPDQTVVFLYKRIEKLVSETKFDNLDLPVDTRMCNGIIQVKVDYDDKNRTVTEYRYTNSGSKHKEAKPYGLIRGINTKR